MTTRLVASHEDETLLTEARDLADELDGELVETSEDDDLDVDESYAGRGTPGGALAHELEDVRLPGARAALRRDGALIAGDGSLPPLAPGRCSEVRRPIPLRACATSRGGNVVVLATDARRERQERRFVVWAVLVGMFVGASLAFFSSGAVARWALGPLDALRDRVRAIDARDPRSDHLESPMPHVELEELRVAVFELVERLGAALTGARGFAAEAAHELRTPLTKLAGEIDMIAETHDLVDDVTIERLRRHVAGLIALVQRLLVLARPDRTDVVGEAIDLGDVAIEVLDALPPPQRARTHLQASDDVIVRGDATLLRALLTNALENALKFSGRAVDLRVGKEHDSCTIDVVDDGPGVPPDERAKVFAPFYRTASSRASGALGHGVGLALIAHVAEAHGGRAEFLDSSHGAHLRIVLPAWTSGD